MMMDDGLGRLFCFVCLFMFWGFGLYELLALGCLGLWVFGLLGLFAFGHLGLWALWPLGIWAFVSNPNCCFKS